MKDTDEEGYDNSGQAFEADIDEMLGIDGITEEDEED
jgi:hypothetical protein